MYFVIACVIVLVLIAAGAMVLVTLHGDPDAYEPDKPDALVDIQRMCRANPSCEGCEYERVHHTGKASCKLEGPPCRWDLGGSKWS